MYWGGEGYTEDSEKNLKQSLVLRKGGMGAGDTALYCTSSLHPDAHHSPGM